ncbi:MAG TPA: hypothetical protein VIE12_02585 [Actinomycetota bacterium]
MRGRTERRRFGALAVAVALLLVACGGGGGSGPTDPGTPTASGPRPASTAQLAIVSPTDGEVIEGSTVALKVDLEGAEIVPATTTNIVPDEGHLHVILDDQLISMTGDLEQTIPDVAPGQHLLKVEFVASDHIPFDPRVIAAVSFETTG